MSWLSEFVRPKIRALVSKEIPDDLWHKCPSCEQMIFHRVLDEEMHVCPHCSHHMRFPIEKRINNLLDPGYTILNHPEAPQDPLKFKDSKKYTERLKEARAKTHQRDAITVASGKMNGVGVVIAALNFEFMGGSMGVEVGNGLVLAAQTAFNENVPLIIVTASGGARMQEAVLSLMQMPRSVAAIGRVKQKGLPYIVVLTDPTMGGVSASFAMVGDITLAEPGAMIGFTGARVIENTLRIKLPEGFQRADYLLEHGMVDQVVDRRELKKKLTNLINILMG